MKKWNRRLSYVFFTMAVAHIPGYAISQMTVSFAAEPSQVTPSKESAYQEVNKDGRLYIFTSPDRKAAFEKSGELGKGIIKIGYGQNGETVVFDSEEAVIEYASRRVKDILGKANIKAYREFEMDGRLYVFASPTRKTDFEKTGEMGKSITKIGYGTNNETVVFDSDEAVVEYDNRHFKK
ncbi:MAG: hypothetical protein AABZ13_04580 [Planctomycetota bacterium]